MLRIFLLLGFYVTTIIRVKSLGELRLGIYSSEGELIRSDYIAKNINDSLVLVCKTRLYNKNESLPKLSWIFPSSKNRPRSFSRPHKILEEDEDSSRLEIDNLQESDYGMYQCIDRNGNKNELAATVNLLIKGSKDCGKGVFCDNHCIQERFKCDGKTDCKDGKDEYYSFCGENPCLNKIRCADGRCIPQEWCCNSSLENCTKRWDVSCCPKINRGPFQPDYKAFVDPYHDADVFREFGDRPIYHKAHHYSDSSFLQTTIYAVFVSGCAILFILVVTILVVVMQCKLQMRRNWQFQLLNRQRVFGNNSTYHRALTQEMDIMDMVVARYNRGNNNSREQQHEQRNAAGLLVTYNINNGVHIVGKPVEPPPYSEVIPSPPIDQGPPPPYVPRSAEGEAASSTNRKPDRSQRRTLSKIQASSEPTLTNIT